MRCFESFDGLCKQIVSPVRFKINQNQIIQRETKSLLLEHRHFQVVNSRNQRLSCLLFINDLQRLPTVIYLHGNGGSKMQVLPLLRIENKRMNVCAFDFAGCGRSDGEYVTYGTNEAADVYSVVEYLRRGYQVQDIHLWGRSMGACAAIMYVAHLGDNVVKSMVLDCPFPSLEKVIRNVAAHQSVPSFVFYVIFYFIKNKVNAIVGKDAFSQHYDQIIQKVKNIPILFGYSAKDYMVNKQDVRKLYQSYSGEKFKYGFECGHSEERPPGFFMEGIRFILNKSRTQNKIHLDQIPSRTNSHIVQYQVISSKIRNLM